MAFEDGEEVFEGDDVRDDVRLGSALVGARLASPDIEDAEGFEDATLLREVATPDSMLQSRQVAEAVNRAIEKLPEELRTAIVLRELEGLSYEEIAETMACPIGTVRSRLSRGRSTLRRLMGMEEEQTEAVAA